MISGTQIHAQYEKTVTLCLPSVALREGGSLPPSLFPPLLCGSSVHHSTFIILIIVLPDFKKSKNKI